MGVLSLGLYVAEKSFGILGRMAARPLDALPMPPVSLSLENTTAEPIAIQCRVDFVLWLSQGVDDSQETSGEVRPRIALLIVINVTVSNKSANDCERACPSAC